MRADDAEDDGDPAPDKEDDVPKVGDVRIATALAATIICRSSPVPNPLFEATSIIWQLLHNEVSFDHVPTPPRFPQPLQLTHWWQNHEPFGTSNRRGLQQKVWKPASHESHTKRRSSVSGEHSPQTSHTLQLAQRHLLRSRTFWTSPLNASLSKTCCCAEDANTVDGVKFLNSENDDDDDVDDDFEADVTMSVKEGWSDAVAKHRVKSDCAEQ